MKKSLKIIKVIWKVLRILCGFTEIVEKNHQDDTDGSSNNNKK